MWCQLDILIALIDIYYLVDIQTFISWTWLYRDDGLETIRNPSGPEVECKRKEIIKLFKESGVNITIKTILKSFDLLDVCFNLANNTYQPYRKPNTVLLYTNKKSNHPPTILKQPSKSINRQLSDISCNICVFNATKPINEQTLNISGFNATLVYENNNTLNQNNTKN